MEGVKARRIGTVVAVLLLISSFALSKMFADMKKSPEERLEQVKKTPVKVKMANVADQQARIAVDGPIRSKNKIEIYSEVPGKLISSGKDFKEGTSFRKGEVLLKLDDTDFRLNLAASRSAFQSSLTSLLADIKLDYPEDINIWLDYLDDFDPSNILQELPTIGNKQEYNFLVSRNIYNQYFAIKSQEAQLRKYTIYAPFDGVVNSAVVNTNTLLRVGQKIGDFLGLNLFELEAGVSLDDASKVEIGDEVLLEGNNLTGLKGKVSRISEAVDASSQSIKVYISVSGPDLYDGMYLNGFILGKSIQESVIIPRYLLIEGSSIYYVENDSLMNLLEVNILHEMEDELIVNGIEAQTLIIDQIVPGAKKGMKVKTEME